MAHPLTPPPRRWYQLGAGTLTAALSAAVLGTLYAAALGAAADGHPLPEAVVDLLHSGAVVAIVLAVLLHRPPSESSELYVRGWVDGRAGRPPASPEEIEAMRPARRQARRWWRRSE